MPPNDPIAISEVRFSEEVEALLLSVVRSGVVAQGPVVRQLEEQFAALTGVDHCIAVNNGTTALIAATRMCDLQPGDEVITTPFTFVATLNAILESGATARFVDIGLDDFNLDPGHLETVISERTRVVMPVHLYGQCAAMGEIESIARRHELQIVEDAAQSHGATIDGRRAGSWGIGCFSLYATKNLTSGEGGLITTNDQAIADRLRVLRNQGMRERYQYEMVGNNYRLTDLAAALCLPQLAEYDQTVARRRANAARLSEGLVDLDGLVVPRERLGVGHVWHQYTVMLDERLPFARDDVAASLASEGISTGIYYPKLVFDYDCYRQHPRVVPADVPVAADVSRRCLSLPVHQHLTAADLDRIISAVRRVWAS